MSRRARVEFPGARHHVYARGVRRGEVFTTPASRTVFLELLGQLPGRFGVEVHGYALMGNHYHLVAHSLEGHLSRAMHFLGSVYASWLNGHEGWEGAAFASRFNNRVIEADVDWMHLLAYVHLNPFRAGLESDIGGYRWTSLGAYMGQEARPDWLTTRPLIEEYGGPHGHLAYLRQLGKGETLGPPDFAKRALWAPGVTGRAGLPTLVARPYEQALSELDEVLDASPGSLCSPQEQALICWWLHQTTSATTTDIAADLGSSQSTISRRIRACEAWREEPWMQALIQTLQQHAHVYLRAARAAA